MNIGFVSTWFERGAAYVTKQYIELLNNEDNDVFVYARGGETYAIGNDEWDKEYVTWGKHVGTVDEICWTDFKRWIEKNNIDLIFFNEQRNINILLKIKINYPKIKLGSYIDYYKQNTINDFKYYDFLICNTRRHYNVFRWHKQCYYVKWGTDTELYKNNEIERNNSYITFFHSAGMSTRKGTKKLIETFMNTDLSKLSKLIIHTQLPISKFTEKSLEELKKSNIEIIEKTVTAPGLYHLGDVYVYPTELDGLGLTLYESLSCGLPVIGTNVGPINEVIDERNGKLVDVEFQYCREDAYYWPMSIVNSDSLYKSMNFYIENKENIIEFKKFARKIAVDEYSWKDREGKINEIFLQSKILNNFSKQELRDKKKKILLKKIFDLLVQINSLVGLNYLNLKIRRLLGK